MGFFLQVITYGLLMCIHCWMSTEDDGFITCSKESATGLMEVSLHTGSFCRGELARLISDPGKMQHFIHLFRLLFCQQDYCFAGRQNFLSCSLRFEELLLTRYICRLLLHDFFLLMGINTSCKLAGIILLCLWPLQQLCSDPWGHEEQSCWRSLPVLQFALWPCYPLLKVLW